VTQFWLIAAVLIVVGLALLVLPALKNRDDGGVSKTAIALAVLFPVAVVALYQGVSTQNWNAETETATGLAQPPVEEMVAALEARLADSDGSVDDWLMLGRSKVMMQDFPAAQNAYQRAWALSGNSNVEAAIGVAETTIYIDKTSLNGEAGELVEWVLTKQPDNPRALWLGGLVSLAKNRQNEAAERWTKLLNYELPDELRALIQQQLAALPAVQGSLKPAGTAVQVTISIDEAFQQKAATASSLFVFVRSGEGGPPLAVKRLNANALPTTVTLSDANVMMQGATLSGKTNLSVTARLSMSGEPIAQPGDIEGSAQWTGEPVNLVIDTVR